LTRSSPAAQEVAYGAPHTPVGLLHYTLLAQCAVAAPKMGQCGILAD
jgi:hypothetical protein